MKPHVDVTGRSLEGKVVAIPLAAGSSGEVVADLIREEGARLMLGASPAQFETLDARIDGREGSYCQPLDLDRPNSASTFFHIAFAQFERIDAVVLEALTSKSKRMTTEKAIELGTRRLLHCLDAVLPYAGKDLHFVCVAPAYGFAAIPIATAFLGAKLWDTRAINVPQVRMSIVSPPTAAPHDAVSFARTIVHLLKESHIPNITEAVLSPRGKLRRPAAKRSMESLGKVGLQA